MHLLRSYKEEEDPLQNPFPVGKFRQNLTILLENKIDKIQNLKLKDENYQEISELWFTCTYPTSLS